MEETCVRSVLIPMLQRNPSVIEPGGLEGGGIESGFLKNGDRRGGSLKT